MAKDKMLMKPEWSLTVSFFTFQCLRHMVCTFFASASAKDKADYRLQIALKMGYKLESESIQKEVEHRSKLLVKSPNEELNTRRQKE
ncbi:hypothetical protein [Nitrososphaera sp. AFS]|uniref:hypothetical protein n=1 Tax=Nitrososphaera sp. AFS TaxID=2301191 RepID=UPI0013923BA4|nr:hypothetical protein [Nitrososphaera sp. AFS]